jgi:hypothetical protein
MLVTYSQPTSGHMQMLFKQTFLFKAIRHIWYEKFKGDLVTPRA